MDKVDVSINVEPPNTNRGAGNTKQKRLEAVIDWVTATFKGANQDALIERIIDGLLTMEKDDFVELDYGWQGYRRTLKSGNIEIFYDGRENMGVCLKLSGKGCRQVEATKYFHSWQIFFTRLLDLEGNVTRLDIALDDFVGYFFIEQILKKCFNDEYSSRFREWEYRGKKKDGLTVYFGSRSSRVFVRFYDKLAKALKDGDDIDDSVDCWNRTEIELKKERASKVAKMISEDCDIGKLCLGILKNYVRFTVKGKDSNKSRWKTWRNWERFLGQVKSVKLAERPEVKTIERKIRWVDRQVAPSLYAIFEAESWEFIEKMIDEGKERLKPIDEHMIELYKKEKILREQDLKQRKEVIEKKLRSSYAEKRIELMKRLLNQVYSVSDKKYTDEKRLDI